MKLNEYFEKTEIGDWKFPVEVDEKKDLNTDHEHVGKTAVITDHANEFLKPFRGKECQITGVYQKFGNIVAYRAKVNGKTFYAPKKDFYVEQSYLEDIYADSSKAEQIKQVLSHWNTQHDYYGPSWDGIELFHFELAKAVEDVGIESVGWYKYQSSKRPDMDGRDWRLIVPAKNDPVSINCHSLLHDDVWTLSTTIFSTREINTENVEFVGHKDHWQRTLLWTQKVAEVLATDGYEYQDTIKKYRQKRKISNLLTLLTYKICPKVERAYERVTGETVSERPKISTGISKSQQKPGKVAHQHDTTDIRPYSIISIHPLALKKGIDYVETVIKHELIHYFLGQQSVEGHNKTFVEIGKELGIKEKYLD